MRLSQPLYYGLFFFCFAVTANVHASLNTTIRSACNLTHNGFLFLEPYLENDDLNVYIDQDKHIKSFPFSSYELITIPSQGSFYIDNIDDSIKNQLRKKICWEPRNQSLIQEYVIPGSVVIDIGAHIGTHTVIMSQCVGKDGIVLAFEPSKKIYRELAYNLVANRCRNTYPIRAAVGKNKSIIDIITSHPQNEGGSYVVESRGGSNSAVQFSLDTFNLDNISFIKIDVENMEADVLDGAIFTILRNKPVILIEIQGNGQRPIQLGENTEEMALISIEKLQKLGYSLTQLPNSVDYLAFPES